jgi:uncharacterized protein (DUF1778 family)
MSRLSIELTPEQHNAIKAMALLEGESIKDFVWKLVEPKLREASKKKRTKTKKPNARLLAAIEESFNMKNAKRYKTAKELFDRYR